MIWDALYDLQILQNLLNLEFPNPAIFDTCDVVYYWSISLLQPIVLDNFSAYNRGFHNFFFLIGLRFS